MRFGETIQTLRKGKGLTLRQLAELVDVGFHYLSKVEHNLNGAAHRMLTHSMRKFRFSHGVALPRIRMAISCSTSSSDQSGCWYLTPPRTMSRALSHMRKAIARRSAGVLLRMISTIIGSMSSTTGCLVKNVDSSFVLAFFDLQFPGTMMQLHSPGRGVSD